MAKSPSALVFNHFARSQSNAAKLQAKYGTGVLVWTWCMCNVVIIVKNIRKEVEYERDASLTGEAAKLSYALPFLLKSPFLDLDLDLDFFLESGESGSSLYFGLCILASVRDAGVENRPYKLTSCCQPCSCPWPQPLDRTWHSSSDPSCTRCLGHSRNQLQLKHRRRPMLVVY